MNYTVKLGDTFSKIARVQYGDEFQSSLIALSNPGAVEPLIAGTTLVIPDIQGAPKDVRPIGVGVDEVSLLIDDIRFRFWQDLVINRSIDSFDTVEFSTPFESDREDFREKFQPFSYKNVLIYIGEHVLFDGTMVGVVPTISPSSKTVSISCYSKPGVLNDCTPPSSAFPLEFIGMDIIAIATSLCAPFEIPVLRTADKGSPFEQVACKPDKRILSFLTELAKQRSLIISNTVDGGLLFQQSVSTGRPVALLRQGESPLISVKPLFSPQEYYSHVTGLESIVIGSEGSQYSIKNSRLKGTLRPMTFSVRDTQGGDVMAVVEAKAGRMFGNAVSYSVDVSTWRDPFGNLWTPNRTIKLIAPDAMIYSEYEFIIRSVQLRKGDSETATLNLVVPGSFDGNIPDTLPWDEWRPL